MANYKDIHGTKIETVTSDPSNPVVGQVWYNSTDKVLKGFTSNPAGSWATSNALNTARTALGAAGIQTAALAFAGEAPPGAQALTESYNGTSWTELADMNTARVDVGSAGLTNTAALVFGGSSPAKDETETWNGSSWTEVGDLNTGRSFLA